MTTPTLPAYIDYGGSPVMAQPYDIRGVNLRGFVIEGKLEQLQSLCDKCLNHGGQTEYRVISPLVLLSFVTLDELRSVTPPDSQRGWFSENEVDFWVFAAAGQRRGDRFVAERLVWFVPYLWVDAPQALLAGREVYGFPKQLGSFVIPRNEKDPARFAASASVFPRYAPDTRASEQMFIEILRTDGSHLSPLEQAWKTIGEAGRGFFEQFLGKTGERILPGIGLIKDLFDLVVHHEQPLVFLKQFRDVVAPDRACYQAVIEAPIKIHNLRGAGLLHGEFDVHIPRIDSIPVANELGLLGADSDGNIIQQSLFTYWADFDFVLEPGREVWSSTPES